MPQYHYKRIFNCCFAELINGHFLHIFSTFFSAKAAPWLVAMAKVPKYSRPGCWCSAWGPGRPKGHSWFFFRNSTKKSLNLAVPRVIEKGGRGMSKCRSLLSLCSIEIQRNEGFLRFFHVLILPCSSEQPLKKIPGGHFLVQEPAPMTVLKNWEQRRFTLDLSTGWEWEKMETIG